MGNITKLSKKVQSSKDCIIHVEHLNKQFIVDKQPIDVLKDINLQVKKGEFVTIVGQGE